MEKEIIGFKNMMKNFTKILLGFIAAITGLQATAMEWRAVNTVDFGGEDESADAICNTEPTDLKTDLTFIGQNAMMSSGKYMVIKATELADMGRGYNLTNIGTVYTGAPTWATGGDHTYPDNKNKGYYMAFDCLGRGNNELLYEKELQISCSNVEFKLEAYFASLEWRVASNTVRVSIQTSTGEVLSEKAYKVKAASETTRQIEWQQLFTTFTVNDASINSVKFVVEATSTFPTGWDIALDDITISVNQPTISISASDFNYEQPATLTATYDQAELNSFFSSSGSNIQYAWHYKKLGDDDSQYTKLTSGIYTQGMNLEYTIPSFKKDENNGVYKLVLYSNGNEEGGLCSVVKEFEINETKDKATVVICQDSTKKFKNLTLNWNDGFQIIGDLEVTVKADLYQSLPTATVYQCKNNDYPTVGTFQMKDIIEMNDAGTCPKTVQHQVMEVTANLITDEAKHLCAGETYITDDNVPKVYSDADIDEKGLTRIEFDYDGCRHQQYIFVHPNPEESAEETVCVGESYGGVSYNTPGVFDAAPVKFKTIWGCDSTVTPKITVVAPTVVDLGEKMVCPSDNYEFGGVFYTTPMERDLEVTTVGSNGCDSTTKIHLIVNEGGEIDMDTLICREQILFGETFSVPGVYKRTRTGFTESGCQRDTNWTIEVVEITLKLRLFNNQTEVCDGQPSSMIVQLHAEDSKGKYLNPTHYWEPEVPKNELKPTLYLHETTTYSLYADLDLPSDVDRNAKGCHAKETVTITVHPLPELSVDSVNPDDRSVEYTITGGTMPYNMFLGERKLGVTESNTDKKDHLPYGTHILQVQDSIGCSAEQEITIEAVKLEPDGFFTPNGDGENDFWKVKNLDTYPTSKIRIFDRFGKLLHEGSGQDFEVGWDGTYNGNKMPATDYWYEIDIDEIDTQYFGHFTLMR